MHINELTHVNKQELKVGICYWSLVIECTNAHTIPHTQTNRQNTDKHTWMIMLILLSISISHWPGRFPRRTEQGNTDQHCNNSQVNKGKGRERGWGRRGRGCWKEGVGGWRMVKGKGGVTSKEKEIKEKRGYLEGEWDWGELGKEFSPMQCGCKFFKRKG